MNKLSDISADGFSLFIVGPQSSGKTIYLMGLSLLERKKGSHFKKSYKVDFSFRPTREGLEKSTPEEKLRDDAERTLFSQTPAAPTERLEKECSFSGKIQYGETEAKFVLLISDTPGELLKGKYKEIEENIQKNIARSDLIAFLVFVDKWSPDQNGDGEFKKHLVKLGQIIGRGNKNLDNDPVDIRLAFVLTKCERGELWTSRNNPEKEIFNKHFVESMTVIKEIRENNNIPESNIEYFALSTFGVLGEYDFRPNRNDAASESATELTSTLKTWNNPTLWHPYGMLSPIYWLITGRRLPPNV